MLTHLAAIGSQEPFPKSSLLAHWMVAMALISWEPLEIPVVGRSCTHQCDEDGFSGHVELAWKTKNITAQLTSKCFLHWIKSVLKMFLFLYLSSTTTRCLVQPLSIKQHTLKNHNFNKVVLARFMCWIFERKEVPLLTPFTQSEGPKLPPIAGTDPGWRKSH